MKTNSNYWKKEQQKQKKSLLNLHNKINDIIFQIFFENFLNFSFKLLNYCNNYIQKNN